MQNCVWRTFPVLIFKTLPRRRDSSHDTVDLIGIYWYYIHLYFIYDDYGANIDIFRTDSDKFISHCPPGCETRINADRVWIEPRLFEFRSHNPFSFGSITNNQRIYEIIKQVYSDTVSLSLRQWWVVASNRWRSKFHNSSVFHLSPIYFIRFCIHSTEFVNEV
jgi:hypothetical protein